MEAALAGDDALEEALGHDVVAGWATFTEALQPTRDALAAIPSGSAWGPRLFVAGDPPELVGWGGFKGAPKDGVVEIGYEIAEARRERGLATAATRAMLAEAFADERVTAVIAHTLPERNASNRVLEKAVRRAVRERRRRPCPARASPRPTSDYSFRGPSKSDQSFGSPAREHSGRELRFARIPGFSVRVTADSDVVARKSPARRRRGGAALSSGRILRR